MKRSAGHLQAGSPCLAYGHGVPLWGPSHLIAPSLIHLGVQVIRTPDLWKLRGTVRPAKGHRELVRGR